MNLAEKEHVILDLLKERHDLANEDRILSEVSVLYKKCLTEIDKNIFPCQVLCADSIDSKIYLHQSIMAVSDKLDTDGYVSEISDEKSESLYLIIDKVI